MKFKLSLQHLLTSSCFLFFTFLSFSVLIFLGLNSELKNKFVWLNVGHSQLLYEVDMEYMHDVFNGMGLFTHYHHPVPFLETYRI